MTIFYVHETEENMVNASKIQGRGRGQLEVQKSIVAPTKVKLNISQLILAQLAQFKEHLAGSPEDPVLSVPIFC